MCLTFKLLAAVLLVLIPLGSSSNLKPVVGDDGKVISHVLMNPVESHHEKSKGMLESLREKLDPGMQDVHVKHTEKETWVDGFTHSTLMILVVEFGDKTFFIQAIMAMTYNKYYVLAGALAALFLMNGISCILGVVLPIIMSKKVTVFVAICLFLFFGVKLIIEGLRMKSSDEGEFNEAEEEVNKLIEPNDVEASHSDGSVTPLVASERKRKKSLCKNSYSTILQVFIMIFFAEWGDRSQLSTILLAGTHPVSSVLLGGCTGYGVMSVIACMFGSYLSSRISPKYMTIGGGVLFLFFGIHTIFAE